MKLFDFGLKQLGVICFSLMLAGMVVAFFFGRNTKECTPHEVLKVDTVYLKQETELLKLQDSIQVLAYEKSELAEQNALYRNSNLSLRKRLWAINEYVRTGRFPADSTIRRKFTGDTGQPNAVRVREN